MKVLVFSIYARSKFSRFKVIRVWVSKISNRFGPYVENNENTYLSIFFWIITAYFLLQHKRKDIFIINSCSKYWRRTWAWKLQSLIIETLLKKTPFPVTHQMQSSFSLIHHQKVPNVPILRSFHNKPIYPRWLTCQII